MGGTSPSDPVLASRLATSNAPPSFYAFSFSFAPLLTRHRSPLGSCPVLLALLPASLLHLLSFARDGYLPLHLPPESPPPSPHWHSSPSHPRCRATTDDDDILHPRSPSTSARRASMPSPSSAPRSASSTRPVSCARGTRPSAAHPGPGRTSTGVHLFAHRLGLNRQVEPDPAGRHVRPLLDRHAVCRVVALEQLLQARRASGSVSNDVLGSTTKAARNSKKEGGHARRARAGPP